jgi:hypothetical protein
MGRSDSKKSGTLKGEFAGEHPGDLVAVAVQVIEACGAGGQGFVEYHAALTSLATEELQRKRSGHLFAVMLASFPLAERP